MFQTKIYAEQAPAYIKQCLLNGTRSPGDPSREGHIARHLGISRGPVREALQGLLLQGLVTGEPQKTRYIRHLTRQEIEDSHCLGGTLEGACIVRSLERLDDAALATVAGILEEMERQSKTAPGLAALSQIDEAFHDALLDHYAESGRRLGLVRGKREG